MISFTKLDAKILTKRWKVRTHDSNALFAKVMLSDQLHEISLAYPWVFLFLSCRVSLAKYIRVLRVLSHPVAGEDLVLLKGWLSAGGLDDSIIISHQYDFVGGCHWKLAMYSNLCYCNRFKSYVVFDNQFWTQSHNIYLWTPCNIIFHCNSMYVMCISLIMRSWLWSWFTEVIRDTRWITGFI